MTTRQTRIFKQFIGRFILCLGVSVFLFLQDSGSLGPLSSTRLASAKPIEEIDAPTLCSPPELRLWGSIFRHGLPLVGATIQIDAADAKLWDNDAAGSCGVQTYYPLDPGVFQWELVAPTGSSATLIGTDTLTPSLTLDLAGTYTVRLIYCTPECLVIVPPSDQFPEGKTFHISPESKDITFNVLEEIIYPPDTQPLAVSADPDENPTDFPDVSTKCNSDRQPGILDPQWVTVNRWSGPDDYELLEGKVFGSKLSRKDSFQNHYSQDHNTKVSVDSNLYHLLSNEPEWIFPDDFMMGVEWERQYFPERFWPTPGDRVSVFGYWIHDCEHNGYTEIHPPVGFITHRPRPILIPDDKVFDFNGDGTDDSTVGTNVYVPGIITEIWFNRDGGEITDNCSDTGLHQPGPYEVSTACFNVPVTKPPACVPTPCTGGPSPINRVYRFNIYLPRSPQAMMEHLGQSAPPAPLYIETLNLDGSGGPDPVIVDVATSMGNSTHIVVEIDLTSFEGDTYSRRIVSGWVYPSPDNWGLTRWRLQVDSISVHDDGDDFLRGPGDWRFWLNINNGTKEWTKIFDCDDCVDDGTVTSSPLIGPAPWRTGAGGVLGPDLLLYPNRPDLNLYLGDTIWINTSGFEDDSAGTMDDLNSLNVKFRPDRDNEYHYRNVCKSEYAEDGRHVFFYSGCGDYTLNFRVIPVETEGANLTQDARALYDAYFVRATDDLNCEPYPIKELCFILPPLPQRPWHPLDYRMEPGSQPRSVYEYKIYKPQASDYHIFPNFSSEEYERFIDSRYNSPDEVAAVYEELKEQTSADLERFPEAEVSADIGSIIRALPADMAVPVVTPPPDTTAAATEAEGARGRASEVLAAFLSGGSATDTVDPGPKRLPPQVAGVDIDNDTLFPIGTTTVTFRFQNMGGIIGSATTNLNVIPSPDLVVQNITTNPVSPSPGQDVSVTVTFTNQGAGDAFFPFFVDLYKNRTVPPVPNEVGDDYCSILGMGAGFTETCVLTVSYDAAGVYEMWAQVDKDQYILEFNENNNVFGPQTITVSQIQYPLTVTKGGTGSGTVTSSPAGINCGTDCMENYNSGTMVTLTAAAASGSTFAGWSGACAGTGVCTVTMDGAKSVTATFDMILPDVSVSLAPDSTSIPRGGKLGYTVTATNNTSSSQTFQYWTYVKLPNGSPYPAKGELLGPVTVTLSAGQAKSAHLTHAIPNSAPLGTYTYVGMVGPYPATWDSDIFFFTVTSSAFAPQGDTHEKWELLEDGLSE